MIGETLVRMLRTFPQAVCKETQFRLLFLKELKGSEGYRPHRAQLLPARSREKTFTQTMSLSSVEVPGRQSNLLRPGVQKTDE